MFGRKIEFSDSFPLSFMREIAARKYPLCWLKTLEWAGNRAIEDEPTSIMISGDVEWVSSRDFCAISDVNQFLNIFALHALKSNEFSTKLTTNTSDSDEKWIAIEFDGMKFSLARQFFSCAHAPCHFWSLHISYEALRAKGLLLLVIVVRGEISWISSSNHCVLSTAVKGREENEVQS